MHKYFIKTPWWARKLFSGYTWRVKTDEKKIYLSFDDGPHPEITPWVLDQLKAYNADASFFCIGSNVEMNPSVYEKIISEGHAVGNHTWSHLNGWKTGTEEYIEDIRKAASVISTRLFRPPYGRIRSAQARQVKSAMNGKAGIIMWDVLSADFDSTISSERCLENVLSNIEKGSIVVFHDSEKAFPHLKKVLPQVLQHLKKEGFRCAKLSPWRL